MEIRNPYTGAKDYRFEPSFLPEIERRVAALRTNQLSWNTLGIEKRIKIIEQFGVEMGRVYDELFRQLQTDTGRPASQIRQQASFLDRLNPRMFRDAREILGKPPKRKPEIGGIDADIRFAPYGVVGVISAWNFPFMESMLDVIPALLAGNAVALKPSELTPRWVEPVRKALANVPELEKVFTIIRGDREAGEAVVKTVNLVCYTGGIASGRRVAVDAAVRLIPAYLELGGNDAAIVLEDADVELAAQRCFAGCMGSSGQRRQSLERVFVARKIYDEFVAKTVELAKATKINYPDIDTGEIAPFIVERAAWAAIDHLADARGRGAQVLTGGEVIANGGLWMEPTIVTDVNHDMRLLKEETFGPVLPIMPFDSPEEAVSYANETEYGLSGAVFAGTRSEAASVGRLMRAGAISINHAGLNTFTHDVEHQPTGLSGLGPSRFGPEGIKRFVRHKAYLSDKNLK